MARNIDKYLEQLRVRRRGVDRLDRLTSDEQIELMSKSTLYEGWQKRAQAQPYTRYALGAMQEVDGDYTRISLETAEKVKNQLDSGLTNAGFSVGFRLQGSVPLNVHIRGVSDVDLLNLDTSFLTYSTYGSRSQSGFYKNPTSRTSIDVLSSLRKKSEEILKNKYPSATVDTSGGKAICIFGGSLARPVDVVPSHWNDTIEYQASGQEYDRGVTIINIKIPETIDNLPFTHIKRITDRCSLAAGGLRKAIRLCKNVKADAAADGNDIRLPSFDIAATMYHADVNALRNGYVYELSILAETQRHLDYLATNHGYAKTLMVPDGSRAIFDTAEKLAALNKLSIEIDDLTKEVAKEQDASLRYVADNLLSNNLLSKSRSALAVARIPEATW